MQELIGRQKDKDLQRIDKLVADVDGEIEERKVLTDFLLDARTSFRSAALLCDDRELMKLYSHLRQRRGKWKLMLPNRSVFYGYVKDRGSQETELYDLETDIGETRNLALKHPGIVEELLALTKEAPRALDPDAVDRIGLSKKRK